ncbi:hypothetical protein ABNC82_20600, partial [Paenibacillus larvae]
INLVILLEIKVLAILLLLFISQAFKSTSGQTFLLVLYSMLYAFPIFYFHSTYLAVFTIFAGFFVVCFALYFCVYLIGARNRNMKGTKGRWFLIFMDIQCLTRRLVETKISLIRFAFPPYILLYVSLFWVLDMFPSFFAQFSIDKDMLVSLSLVLYVGIYS